MTQYTLAYLSRDNIYSVTPRELDQSYFVRCLVSICSEDSLCVRVCVVSLLIVVATINCVLASGVIYILEVNYIKIS